MSARVPALVSRRVPARVSALVPALMSRRVRALVPALVLGMLAAACAGSGSASSTDGDTSSGGRASSSADPDAPLRITTLSGPAAYVTGGDAVVAVDSPAGHPLDDVRVTLDGADVTDRFTLDTSRHRPAAAPPRLVATLTGLPEGTSRLKARNGADDASLTITDHPVAGPLLSGAPRTPFVCTTEAAGLGPADDDCAVAEVVGWRYMTTSGQWAVLRDPSSPPADVTTTTTTEGRRVPFVVRLEHSVQNRSITEIAVLDPGPGAGSTGPSGPAAGATTGATPSSSPDGGRPWDDSGWNGRLVMRFGGGCGTTWSQGTVSPTALQPDLLGAGYAVLTGSLTSLDTACNTTLSAETAMVAKEHFVETYGVPRHTIGSGGSGGAIQQLQIAQNQPGILDALAPAAAFPDTVSIAPGASDCGLLERWFGRDGGSAGVIPNGEPSGSGLTDAQQMAVTGFASPATCRLWTQTFLQSLDASEGCAAELVGQVYDLAVRPDGVRCTWQDSNAAVVGTDPTTGYAARPLDNVGVQYGLDAVRSGAISVDQFLDLNEGIGGYDLDGAWQPQRHRASDDVLERVYRAGLVTAGTATGSAGALGVEGSGGLVDVPVIVLNAYTDPLGDVHDRQRAFALRERLRRPDGTDDPSLSIWTVPAAGDLSTLVTQLEGGAEDYGQPVVRVLDQWLTAAEDAPASAGTWAERLAAAKPAEATDRCELPSGEVVTGAGVYDQGTACAAAYPLHADPRRAAGAPLVGDVVACSLVDVDPSAYGVALTDAQVERLRRIFPDGVCDWSQPGRGQRPPAGTWQSF